MNADCIIIQGEASKLALLLGWTDIRGLPSSILLREGIRRLDNVPTSMYTELTQWCHTEQLDIAVVPTDRRITDFGLLAMDMDSTLIAVECIDELADMLGLKAQVAAITQASMRGDMPFAESLTRRAALLAGLNADMLQQVYDERVCLNPGAERLITRVQQCGIKTMLISGGFTFFSQRLQTRLQLDYSAANQLEIIDGRLTGRILGKILDAQSKAEWLVRIRDELGLSAHQIVAIGDGANDLPMLNAAGVSFAYHAKPVVRAQAKYTLHFNGLDAILPILGDQLTTHKKE